MEIGTVRQIDINTEIQAAYLDYAMSVIVARALPDVRDGLKPVHRRILYAMHDMGLTPDKPYRKSARIVGEVLGKYHPHGDAAVYESMVRMAQDFSMRYPLIDGQGNFGSVDGDEAAAMRYTEARLHPIAIEMLSAIEQNTVPFGPNFDGTLDEPLVLPSAFPNFLVNGASGIAVGMATNVPPHNLSEVCDALQFMITHYEDIDSVTIEDLMQFVRGPDFPTGGIVYRFEKDAEGNQMDVIKAAYAVGRGRFTVQARAHLEEMSRNRTRIVVTELPYQVNKTRLTERIAELVREGRLEGVADLRDESDRQGMRLVIELTRTVDPKEVLGKLYKLTPMQTTFGVNILALVDGEPRTLSLKRALWHYLEHRQDIVTRRSQFELDQARRQAHILEGLLIALDNLDEVINTIRRSQNVETAKSNLVRKFKLTEIQAQAILDMPLRRLAALEQKKLREEYKERVERIAYLQDLLTHPKKIRAVISAELDELKRKYGDERRTQLVEHVADLFLGSELIAKEEVLVIASTRRIWRESLASRHRGFPLNTHGQGLNAIAVGYSTNDVALITTSGRGVLVPIHQIPSGQDMGCTLGELLNSSLEEELAAAIVMPATQHSDETPPGFLVFVSSQGKIKRSLLAEFLAVAGRGLTTIMGIEPGDRLVNAFFANGDEDIVLITSSGQTIRFAQSEVRSMGLQATGVAGVKLAEGDKVVGAGCARTNGQVVIVTELGFGKKSALTEYPLQRRYGTGVVGGRPTARTGRVIGGGVISSDDELFLVSRQGQIITLLPDLIPDQNRPAQGKALVKLGADDPVTTVVILSYGAISPRRGTVSQGTEQVDSVLTGPFQVSSPSKAKSTGTLRQRRNAVSTEKAIEPEASMLAQKPRGKRAISQPESEPRPKDATAAKPSEKKKTTTKPTPAPSTPVAPSASGTLAEEGDRALPPAGKVADKKAGRRELDSTADGVTSKKTKATLEKPAKGRGADKSKTATPAKGKGQTTKTSRTSTKRSVKSDKKAARIEAEQEQQKLVSTAQDSKAAGQAPEVPNATPSTGKAEKPSGRPPSAISSRSRLVTSVPSRPPKKGQ